MPTFALTMAVLSLGFTAGADEGAARQRIRATYTFSPHTLTTQQISEKSKLLDALWAEAKAAPTTFIPALRSELARTDAQTFFVYDGSMLLLSLSNASPDRRLALAAIARSDLRDVQHAEYLRQVHSFAALGEDTTEAALHILVEPEFKAFLPQHALTLGQDYALVCMLLPLDAAKWSAPAIARLSRESEAKAQKSLLLLLWYAQTAEADAAIMAFTADRSKTAANRLYAQQLLARNSKSSSTSPVGASQGEESLRAARREIMKRLSDEALIELDQKTLQIAAARRSGTH